MVQLVVFSSIALMLAIPSSFAQSDPTEIAMAIRGSFGASIDAEIATKQCARYPNGKTDVGGKIYTWSGTATMRDVVVTCRQVASDLRMRLQADYPQYAASMGGTVREQRMSREADAKAFVRQAFDDYKDPRASCVTLEQAIVAASRRFCTR
jgi:hypothetical protein